MSEPTSTPPQSKSLCCGLSRCGLTHLILIWVLGLLSAFVYYQILGQSFDCEQSDLTSARPIRLVLYLFTIAGALYLIGCWRFIWKAQ